MLRHLTDRLLRAVLALAAAAFLAQGVAFVAALLVAGSATFELGTWTPIVRATAARLATLFIVGGALLGVSPWFFDRMTPAHTVAVTARGRYLAGWLLTLSLTTLAVSMESFAAWRVVGTALGELGATPSGSHGQMSGFLFAPFAIFLYVPAIVTLSALALVALPALLAVSVVTRSNRLGGSFAATVIFCGVLILAALLSRSLFFEGVGGLSASLAREGDRASREIAAGMARWPGSLEQALRYQVMLWLGLLAAAPFALRPLRRTKAHAALTEPLQEDEGPAQAAPGPAVDFPPAPAAISSVPGRHSMSGRRPSPRGPAVAWPVLLAVLGISMLGIGTVDLLRPRARWMGADPGPGATVDGSNVVIQVRFDRPLGPGSTLAVTRTLAVDPTAPSVAFEGGIDPEDPSVLAATVGPETIDGLYWVSWRAVPAGSAGVARRGSYPFRVGTAVPAFHLDGARESAGGSDERGRQRRALLLSGVLFLAMAGFAARLATRSGAPRMPGPPASPGLTSSGP